ncbi:MAG: amidohydrolase family protein [Desulfosporosinus sp.]|nr:amidohydrolase family protein [Desulfosporosinus sp.]
MNSNEDTNNTINKHDNLTINAKHNENVMNELQPICDAHIHFFPDRLMGAILDWFEQHGLTMLYRQSVETLLDYLQSIGVRSAFVLGYIHKKDMSPGINLWLKDLCEKNPWLKPFAALHQDDTELEKTLSQALDEWNFPGVKLHTFVQKVAANDKRLWPIYRMLNERRKGIILHLGGLPTETPYTRVDSLLDVLKSFPNLKVTIAHMGLPDDFSLAAKMAASYPNVYLDSAFIFGNPRLPLQEDWLKAIDANPSKFIFGTDFPIMDYSPLDSIQAVSLLPLTQAVKTQLLWDNAMRFLQD